MSLTVRTYGPFVCQKGWMDGWGGMGRDAQMKGQRDRWTAIFFCSIWHKTTQHSTRESDREHRTTDRQTTGPRVSFLTRAASI
mmetsp:Transcript_45051/g.127176  ORF Transcript_45051/g.127176 Transcript_45051/m.127176 type:complete len:83 (-) Transcript_45051:1179-1427(-)